VTENEQVRRCVEYNLGATPISGLTDAAISHILRNEVLLDELLKKNARLLGEAMDLCADWAEFHEFPYVLRRAELMGRIVEANAACYFTIDFGRLVPGLGLPDGASALDGEIAIMERMISRGVHIVSPSPG
jgi:hypothetical protein